MVIKLRNRVINSPPKDAMARDESPIPCLRRTSTVSPSSPGNNSEPDSPPLLRSSSSSFDQFDTEDKPSFGLVGGFKWLVGAAVVGFILSVVRLGHVSIRTSNGSFVDPKLQALYDLPLPKTPQELISLNDELAELSPAHILQWAHHHLHDTPISDAENSHPLAQATSFGPTGLVIMDHLAKGEMLETVPVITMDTLHLFEESYTFYETVKHHYGKNLHMTITKPLQSAKAGFAPTPITTKQQFNTIYSPDLWKNDPKLYTKMTKNLPMQQKLNEWRTQMWITGRRRSQGGERKGLDILEFEPFPSSGNATSSTGGIGTNVANGLSNSEYEPSRGRWKLNPLAYWSYDQVWSYIRSNSVPYNPLYDAGYTSIGDVMTTSLPSTRFQSASGEHGERSGRFVGFGVSNKECGLHVDLDMDLKDMEVDDSQ